MTDHNSLTWFRLTLLAMACREKYAAEHPELKNGSHVDIGDYLSCLFDLMVEAGVTFPDDDCFGLTDDSATT